MCAHSPSPKTADPTIADRFWHFPHTAPTDANPLGIVSEFLAALRRFHEDGAFTPDEKRGSDLLLEWLRRQEVAGDLTYASPEQARGEPVDERSLVFSVGVLLFERLTGRHPFGVESRAERESRLKRVQLASGVNYFPQIPAELRSIIVVAIAAFPEERWHNLLDLERQLAGFVQLANTPESKRVLAQHRLPALPDSSSPPPSGPRKPLRADSSIDHRFRPVLTREVQLERLATQIPTSRRRLAIGSAVTLALGALVIGIVPLGLSQKSEKAPTRTEPLAQPVAPIASTATNPVATRTPATVVATGDTKPQPEPGPAASASTSPEAPAEPVASGASDPVEGDPVLAAALGCFKKSRLSTPIYFGASLVVDPQSRRSTRAFLGGAAKLTHAEKLCLQNGLVDLPTASGTEPLAEYRFMLSTSRSFAKAKTSSP